MENLEKIMRQFNSLNTIRVDQAFIKRKDLMAALAEVEKHVNEYGCMPELAQRFIGDE